VLTVSGHEEGGEEQERETGALSSILLTGYKQKLAIFDGNHATQS